MDRPDPASFPPAPFQEQFLRVLPRDEAVRLFQAALDPRPIGQEQVAFAEAVGRVLACDLLAAIDVPPFDRALVDGFAVRAEDLAEAGETSPTRLRLNPEVVACGTEPALEVRTGTATPIATGAPLPRGADAVVMIEGTEPARADVGSAIDVRRAVVAGAGMAFAGSDMVVGETLSRRGTVVGSREIGVAAAAGLATLSVFRRPRIAVISTGDELTTAGDVLRPAAIYDSNGPVVAAALREEGCEPVPYGIVPDDERLLAAAMARAHRECDGVILSGGTSKGAGDLTYRLVAALGEPGIVAHGVALKPGKPLLLAVCAGKPVVVLPGFPTSAMFTFHDIVAPELRRMAGLPARATRTVPATFPVRLSSELGRTEFVMVSLVTGADGLAAYPLAKGSGSVTAFAQADGFVTVEALADSVAAGSAVSATLFSPNLTVPDLVVIGSHCTGLEVVMERVAAAGFALRSMALGSQGGVAAARRGECDLAPMHLLHADTGLYNRPFLTPGLELVEGWRRMQGVLFRPGDDRFEGRRPEAAVAAALADAECRMVGRNAGAGTRILIDRLLGESRPAGYSNQPRSHNAVAAAVAQGRADWGVAIRPVAEAYALGFLPLGEEHYDFALVAERRERPAVVAFLRALADPETRARLTALGFRPADA